MLCIPVTGPKAYVSVCRPFSIQRQDQLYTFVQLRKVHTSEP